MTIFHACFIFALGAVCAVATDAVAQRARILQDVKTIQVPATVVPDATKVKEDFAPKLIEDSLRNALKNANFEVGETAPIRAHIVLDEFTSGGTTNERDRALEVAVAHQRVRASSFPRSLQGDSL